MEQDLHGTEPLEIFSLTLSLVFFNFTIFL